MVTGMRQMPPRWGFASDADKLESDQRVFVVGSVVGGADYVGLSIIRG